MEAPPPEDHSFTPPNHKLITVYLRRRIAGEPLPSGAAAYFHDIDIFGAEPAALTAGLQPLPGRIGEASSWLFFTPVKTKSSTDSRRSRRVGGGVGTWHSEHAPEAVVDDEGNRVGHRQLFSYKDMGRKRTGWSMWEFGGADQEGGEKLLVLCKIHQGHACSRRADGSAARSSARKRKGTDDVDNNKASAPTKRRLFAPPAQTQPAASEGKISATSETIHSSRDETAPSGDKIGATLDAIPCFWGETDPLKDTLSSVCSSLVIPDAIPSSSTTEASKDVPKSVLSFWEEPCLLQQDMIEFNATTSSSVLSSLPKPDASQKNIISTTMESPTSFLILEPEGIPSSRTETEEPRSVLSFWDEPYPLQQDSIGAALSRSFSPKPDAVQDNVISSTTESPASFFIPEPQTWQGEMVTLDSVFEMDNGAPPTLESCNNGSFMDDSDDNVSGVPMCAPGGEISGHWTGYDTVSSSCSVGNAFKGDFSSYDQIDVGASSSWTGYDTAASFSDCKDSFSGLHTYSSCAISGSAGVQYGCGMPFLPSMVHS